MRPRHKPPPSLSQMQQCFADALLDTACEPALSELVGARTGSVGRATYGADSAGHAIASLRERVALYRGNLRAHVRNALANAYPVLLALSGDAYFDALARAYDLAHPSPCGDLNAFGDSLPAFVEHYDTDPRHAHFGDLARLEWAVHRAHYATDIVAFTPTQWREFGEARLLDARLALHPGCSALALRHAVAAIWLTHQQHDGIAAAAPCHAGAEPPTHALVVRPRWRAWVIEQSAAAHAAFVMLQRGTTLNDALDAAFEQDPTFDFAGQWQQWIANGAITGAFAR